MALGTLSVVASSVQQTNNQRFQKYLGQLTVSAFADTYPVGGMALDSVLQAALLPQSNQKPIRVDIWSELNSGYIYSRNSATGKMQILQVPPTGSLTTASPLQEVPSNSTSLSGPFEDVIRFEATYLRNT